EQQSGADDRTEEDAEAAERRIEPDRARQLLPIDEVMEHHLLGRTPQTSGQSVDDEQHAGLPQLQRVRRSEEHTSELQSRFDLVCRLLLENKKSKIRYTAYSTV